MTVNGEPARLMTRQECDALERLGEYLRERLEK